MKWGESVCDLTTKGKLSNDCNTTKMIGLKVDARFLANINMDSELIDVSNMEAAKYQDRSKLHLDKAKLSVETKCLLDNLVLHCDPSVVQDLKLMNVQICGIETEVCCLSLVDSGVYVVHEYAFDMSLPSTIENSLDLW